MVLDTARLEKPFPLKRAGDYANPEIAGDVIPLPYGDLSAPAVAEGVYTLPQIDTVNFRYGISSEPVLTAAQGNAFTFYDDGGLIDPAGYTVTESGDLEGNGLIAYVTFTAARTGTVRGRLKGKASAGVLIENPISIAEDIALAGGIDPAAFDSSSLEKQRQFATAQGYKAAGVIEAERPVGELIQEVLGDFLGHFRIDGLRRLRFFFEPEGAPNAERELAGGIAERDTLDVEVVRSIEDIINEAPIVYAFDWNSRRYRSRLSGEGTKNTKSQSLFGVRRPPGGSFELRWVRDAVGAFALQNVLIARFGSGVSFWEATDSTIKLIAAEPGDYLRGSLSWLYAPADVLGGGALTPIRNQIMRVINKEIDTARGEIRLKLLDTGDFLTTADLLDGSKTLGGEMILGAARDTQIYE